MPAVTAEQMLISKHTEQLASLDVKAGKAWDEIKAMKATVDSTFGGDAKTKLNKILTDVATVIDDVSKIRSGYTERMDALEKEQQSMAASKGIAGGVTEVPAVRFIKDYSAKLGVDPAELHTCQAELSNLVNSKFNRNYTGDFRRYLAPDRFVKAVTSLDTSAGDLQVPEFMESILPPGEELITLIDMLPMTNTLRSRVHWRTERLAGRVNNAGIQSLDFTGVGQGTALGKSDFKFDDHNEEMRTFGHVVDVSLQILQDQPQLMGYMGGRMRYMVRWDLEDNVILGTNKVGAVGDQSKQLNSLNTAATAYDLTLVNDLDITRTHRIDVLRTAKLQGDNTYIPTTAFLLNRNDIAAIQVLKDNHGRYLFTNNVNMPNEIRPWGVPTIGTNHTTEGTFFCIPLNMCELCIRKQWENGISYDNNDNFEKLLVTLRIYGRFGFKMYYPASIIKGSFSTAVAA